MGEADRSTARRPVRGTAVVAVVVTAVLVAAGAVALVVRPWEGSRARPGVPSSALSPAGTALPDGLVVPVGTRLVGTPVQDESEGASTPGWRAVLLVDDDPLRAWRGLLGELDRALALSLDVDATPGCSDDDGFACALDVGGTSADGPLAVRASIEKVEGDVTGHWTIVLRGDRGAAPPEGVPAAWTGGDAPDAPGARPRPEVGDPLAPDTLAEGDDGGAWVLLEGSELLVQYSPGSLTGGFGVLLRVSPDAAVADVAARYAEQATQFDGPVDSTTTTTPTSTVTRLVPPGGAGGYQAAILAVDNATGDDLVYYDLLND